MWTHPITSRLAGSSTVYLAGRTPPLSLARARARTRTDAAAAKARRRRLTIDGGYPRVARGVGGGSSVVASRQPSAAFSRARTRARTRTSVASGALETWSVRSPSGTAASDVGVPAADLTNHERPA